MSDLEALGSAAGDERAHFVFSQPLSTKDYLKERPSDPTKTVNSLLTLERDGSGLITKHSEEVRLVSFPLDREVSTRRADPFSRFVRSSGCSGITRGRLLPRTGSWEPSTSGGRRLLLLRRAFSLGRRRRITPSETRRVCRVEA